MYTTFKCTTTLVANDSARERVAVLIFLVLLFYAFFFGGLTPLLVVRCFLLNGAFGLVFGWLYRKYGIQYAMLSHALLHIVSKTIWLIFT